MVGAAAAAVSAYLVVASPVVVAAQLNFAVAVAAAGAACLVVVRQVVVAAAAAVAAYLVVVKQAVVVSLAPRQPRATLRRPRSHCSCGAPTAGTASLPGSERAARARAPMCAPWPAPAAGSCCVTMMRRAALHRTQSEVSRTPRSACAPPPEKALWWRCCRVLKKINGRFPMRHLCSLVRFWIFVLHNAVRWTRLPPPARSLVQGHRSEGSRSSSKRDRALAHALGNH